MDKKEFDNPLSDFDFSILDNPEFKEDAVREEIIFPILKELGYSASGENKIVRSRRLKHPYVSIGSQQKAIHIIPDYVMEINNIPCWICEAKAPAVNILDIKHTGQAYSYAIHPDIHAKYFALCNGREFLLYSIEEFNPILHFNLSDLCFYWEKLKSFLSPTTLLKNFRKPEFLKDYGLHILQLGFSKSLKFYYYTVPVDSIAKINNDLYTFSVNLSFDNSEYCASFDFDFSTFLELEYIIPYDIFSRLKQPVTDSIIQVKGQSTNPLFYLNIECMLGELCEVEKEIFLPLKVIHFNK